MRGVVAAGASSIVSRVRDRWRRLGFARRQVIGQRGECGDHCIVVETGRQANPATAALG